MTKDPIKKAEQKQVENLEKNSGKKISEWISIVSKTGFSKHGEMVKYLKEEHGLGHGNANLIVHYARQSHAGVADEKDLIASQYKGKENLQPIYDKLMEKITAFGNDIQLSPKKAYMSLRRKKQFAIIQPSTKTRLDVGVNLKGVDPTGSLEAAGSWNSMCTHRIKITDISMVDDEIIRHIKTAYEQAG